MVSFTAFVFSEYEGLEKGCRQPPPHPPEIPSSKGGRWGEGDHGSKLAAGLDLLSPPLRSYKSPAPGAAPGREYWTNWGK